MTITLDGTAGITTPAVDTGNVNGGQLSGMRNKIINGAMEIAQRGTSFAITASAGASTYNLDRWYIWNATDAASTITQDTASVPSSNEFQYSLRLAVTTADNSLTTPQNSFIGQNIEGYNARDLIGKTFTLSFWVRSSKTGTHCLGFRNSGVNRSYVMEYTVNSANTWEYKSVTVTNGLITAGTWNWTNGIGLGILFAVAASSSVQTTAGAWQTGNFYATSGQVNCLDTIGNIFAITGVQLEVGDTATPFEHRPIGTELALCQRYYYKTFPQATAPAQNAGTTGAFLFGAITNNTTGLGAAYNLIPFPVIMRAAPTVTTYNPSAANAQARNTSSAADFSSTSAYASEWGWGFTATSGNWSIGQSSAVHATATIEL